MSSAVPPPLPFDADRDQQLQSLWKELAGLPNDDLFALALGTCFWSPEFQAVWGQAAYVSPMHLRNRIYTACALNDRFLYAFVATDTYPGPRLGKYASGPGLQDPGLPFRGVALGAVMLTTHLYNFAVTLDTNRGKFLDLLLQDLQGAGLYKPPVEPWTSRHALLCACVNDTEALLRLEHTCVLHGFPGLSPEDAACIRGLCSTDEKARHTAVAPAATTPTQPDDDMLFCDEVLELPDYGNCACGLHHE
jgi:hypothetical protein